MGSFFNLTFGIVGLGQIGGSLARALRTRVSGVTIVGSDRDPDLLSRAVSERIVDRTTADAAELIAGADVVILALPIGEILKALSDHASLLQEKTLVADTGSLKQSIMDRACGLHLRNFIGGHPMAGTQRRGVAAWDAGLFADACYFISVPEDCTADAARTMDAFIRSLGAVPIRVDPVEHDSLLATTSGLPHILAFGLRRLLDGSGVDAAMRKCVQGPSFKSATRVAESDPRLVFEMLWRNRHNLGDAIRNLRDNLEDIEQSIRDDDENSFRGLLNLD